MKDIIIISSGFFGVQVFDLIAEINEKHMRDMGEMKYRVKGFLTDSEKEISIFSRFASYLGDWKCWSPSEEEVYALGIVDPKKKEEVVQYLTAKNAKFETLIGPRALIPTNIVYGQGCILNPYCLKDNSVIGSYVTMWATMAAKIEIGNYTSTMGFANITDAFIGEKSLVEHHGFIAVGNSMGNNAVLRACSLAVRNIRDNSIVTGVPARKEKSEYSMYK